MQCKFFCKVSLKSKMALAATALFASFVIGGSYLTLSYFETSFKESIATQQFALVTSLSGAIDDKLNMAQDTLVAASLSAPPDAFANHDSAQLFLDTHTALQSIFDNDITLVTRDGVIIAEGQYDMHRGHDVSSQEWYRKTLVHGKPHISAPYSAHSTGHPAVMMTVPIFNKNEKVIGMLTGSLDLLGENFLARVSRSKVGERGYLYITDTQRTLIVHPDPARIMKTAVAPGINLLYDRAINGFEGSSETITSTGTAMLSSCKRLGMTPWILVANYPITEAYAPVHRAETVFVVAAMVATMVWLLITWFFMRHLMSPLAEITRHLEGMPDKSGPERLMPVNSMDEIGVVAKTFNAMIDSLDRQREELTAQALLLEKEITERTGAQEALLLKQQLLEVLNNCLEERIAATVDDLRQKDRMLIQQSRQAAMGEMFDNIAHQWRQPLNNLGLIVQGLQLSFVMGELGEEELDKQVIWAMNTIGFMSRTIDDFRNYFSPDKEKVVFNLHSLVLRTISIIEGSLKSQGIKVEIHVTEDPEISGYPNEYSQVILNILINARDALAEKRTTDPRVVVTVGMESGKAVVVIADNGGGVPQQVIGRIFDPYFTTKGPGKGTGIGLFMSKTIIEKNLGGALTVRNTAEGAEFRVVV